MEQRPLLLRLSSQIPVSEMMLLPLSGLTPTHAGQQCRPLATYRPTADQGTLHDYES